MVQGLETGEADCQESVGDGEGNPAYTGPETDANAEKYTVQTMIITTRACPHCGFYLRQIGDDPEHVLCPNNYCSEKFADCCPRCDSDKKEVRLVRVGLTAFTCLDCGQDWDNVKTTGLPSSSNLVVLRFPNLATGS